MRINPSRKNQSQYKQGFISGIVTVIILGGLTIVGKHVVVWLSNSPLDSFYQWATTPHTLYIVPVDLFWSLAGLALLGLIITVTVTMMMYGPRVRT